MWSVGFPVRFFTQSSCEISQKYGFQFIDRKREREREKTVAKQLAQEHEMLESPPWSVLQVLKSSPSSMAELQF